MAAGVAPANGDFIAVCFRSNAAADRS